MVGLLIPAVAAAALLAAITVFRRDMRRAYARLGQESQVVRCPWGEIEYAEGGAGVPVLISHGSGGGFDQGRLFAEALLGEGFRWIAPSRFGYLRSTVPPEATFAAQGDAYALLLDRLGIERAAVVAVSHGGPAALWFAIRHPQRISSLTLLSAGVASGGEAAQAGANAKGNALRWIFERDYRYWVMTRLFRGRFLELMGAGRKVLMGLPDGQRRLAEAVIDRMHPARPRAAGVALDNTAAMPDERVGEIRTPTLVVHAEDDSLQLIRNAEFAAARIPGAKLVRFRHGGHLVVAVELERVRGLVREQVRGSGDERGGTG